MENLVIHLFNFVIDTSELEVFNKVGRENFEKSITEEEGTLFMSLAHDKNDKSKVNVFEIYKDNESYEKHRKGVNFKYYVENAGHIILEREMIDLEDVMLIDNIKEFSTKSDEDIIVSIARVELGKESVEKIYDSKANIEKYIRGNRNILVNYILKDKNSNSWYFYQIGVKRATFSEIKDLVAPNKLEILELPSDAIVKK